MSSIRIGNGCGFWGDSLDAPIRLAEQGRLHYLTLEYLAELTMSILAKLKERDPAQGYAHDFLDVLDRLGPIFAVQPNLKIVTNAGGMNPSSCGQQAQAILVKNGLSSHPVAVVSGDDLLPHLDELLQAGHSLVHLDSGAPLETIRERVVSANAYLGAKPIADALAQGAKVVVTGRVADASLTVGPLVHEFGWAWEEWNRLAAGTTAGHLIECGAQVTGGLWINADESTHLETVGYPIAEVHENGDFIITKPEGTGGAVNVETVSEQLLYEVMDPARYYTPDVIADFTASKLNEIRRDGVSVMGCRGLPAPDSYKVSIAYRDGYSAAGTLVLVGPQAAHKARRSGEILLERLRQAGVTYQHSHIEVLGSGDVIQGITGTATPPEVVLRVGVRDASRAAVERFTKEFAPLVTSGFAGTTGYTTGRAQVREVFAYWPALIAKSAVAPSVHLVTS
jgi:hypothetical protein